MIVWLVSYPRSGNTFTRILCESIFPIQDTYTIHHEDVTDRSLLDVFGPEYKEGYSYIGLARDSEEVFFVKSHRLRDDLVDLDRDKVVYIVRDGRASISSYFHFIHNFTKAKKSLRNVIAGKVIFGDWSSHVLSWFGSVESKNFLLLKYEDIISDPVASVLKISSLSGLEMMEADIPTFDELHAMRPEFFRSGNNNRWRDDFSFMDYLLFLISSRRTMSKAGYKLSNIVCEGAGFLLKKLDKKIK
jgi:Sulfotransferase domain